MMYRQARRAAELRKNMGQLTQLLGQAQAGVNRG
jgi:hypothetical protein